MAISDDVCTVKAEMLANLYTLSGRARAAIYREHPAVAREMIMTLNALVQEFEGLIRRAHTNLDLRHAAETIAATLRETADELDALKAGG
jgi:hypothetical protein